MQDVLEDYFGRHRVKGGRADNPTAQQFVMMIWRLQPRKTLPRY